MAQIPVRMTTREMAFPLLSSQQGPTVIDGRGDLTFIKGASSEARDSPSALGYPGVYYAHNVLPSTYGWQSVGYVDKWGASATSGFFDIEICQGATIQDSYPSSTSRRTYIAAVYNGGANTTTLYYRTELGAWDTPLIDGSGVPLSVAGKIQLTTADLNGVTYIYFQGAAGAYVLDTTLGTLYLRTLAGLNIADIRGIFSSSGYMLAWTRDAVSWSSVVDVEDFVPSDVTDAGGGSIQEIQGEIIYCRPCDLGFIVFSDINSVIALYTANSKFPFEFRELSSSGGVATQLQVSREDVDGKAYAYTTSGIQAISQLSVENSLVQVSDFISGRIFEDLDDATLTFTVQSLAQDMGRAIETVANRYIIISYSSGSMTDFTHAIVIDSKYQRMGKLKIPHVSVFPYKTIQSGVLLDSRSQVAFLQTDGTVKVLDLDIETSNNSGIILFGKFQYVRTRWLQMQQVEMENGSRFGSLEAYLYTSYTGDDLLGPISGYPESPDIATARRKSWYFESVGKNLSLLFKGGFDIVSLVTHFNVHGKY